MFRPTPFRLGITLVLLCLAAACSQNDDNLDEGGDPPIPTTGINGKLNFVRGRAERIPQIPDETDYEKGEAIVIRRGTSDVASALKGMNVDVRDDKKSPYALIVSKGIQSQWKSVRKRELLSAVSPGLEKEAAEVRSKANSFILDLQKRKDLFSTVVPNYWRKTMATSSFDGEQWALDERRIDDVWSAFGDGTNGENKIQKEVWVAVIDTGISKFNGEEHPNLKENLLLKEGYDFVSLSDDNDGIPGIDSDPTEPASVNASFHGTHVAGIIASRESPGEAMHVRGVAPGVKILPIRALGPKGGSDYDIAQAILYAAGLPNVSGNTLRKRADIINLSLGGAGESPVLEDAVARAAAAGVLIVAAAGNDSTSEESFPAAYPEVIGIGALKQEFTFASDYSNFGPNVDLMAPGGGLPDIGRTNNILNGILSTWNDPLPAYKAMSGTSMASPFVAGLAALALGINPDLGVADLRKLFLETATLNGLNDCSGKCGRGEADPMTLLQNAARAKSSESRIDFAQNWIVISADHPTGSMNLSPAGAGTIHAVPGKNGEDARIRYGSVSGWLTVSLAQAGSGIEAAFTVDPRKAGDQPQSAVVQITTDAAAILYPGNPTPSKSGIATITVHYEPASGVHVVLLTASDRKPVSWTATSQSKGYRYHFDFPSADGEYFLYAGRDDDGDGSICSVGDYCGAYPTVDDPKAVKVTKGTDLNDLDFPITPNYHPDRQVVLPSPTKGTTP